MHTDVPWLTWVARGGAKSVASIVKRSTQAHTVVFLNAHCEEIPILSAGPIDAVVKTMLALRPALDTLIFMPKSAGVNRLTEQPHPVNHGKIQRGMKTTELTILPFYSAAGSSVSRTR